MKRMISLILSLLLICSMAVCAGAESQGAETDFVWQREGYFADENENYLVVGPSIDAAHPGWYVSCLLGEDIRGWYVQQEGNTLHGNLVADGQEEDPFVVTLAEEGEDGLVLTVEGGETYHFIPMDMEEASIVVTVNTKGFGEIATAKADEELAFDDEYPMQSAYVGLAEPETYVFGARPDEGWKFMKWTRDGEDYSKDDTITVELTESADFIAVFGIAGTDETPVDLESVTTLGEVLGLPNYGSSCVEDYYVYAFEQDGIFYRAIAACSEDVLNAVFELDWDDEDYDAKLNALIAPLEVIRIENLTEAIPAQEELDQLIGKTGQQLIDEGWINSGWNLEDMEFYMNYGPFSYIVTFDGQVDNYEDFDEEDINSLIVKSVRYDDLGDPTNLDIPLVEEQEQE